MVKKLYRPTPKQVETFRLRRLVFEDGTEVSLYWYYEDEALWVCQVQPKVPLAPEMQLEVQTALTYYEEELHEALLRISCDSSVIKALLKVRGKYEPLRIKVPQSCPTIEYKVV